MDAYLLDWASLLLRWTHVIVAIAWVGASFYFVFLDNSLKRPTDPQALAGGVDGELWAVHGGGFYNPRKYLVAPPTLPQHLHWFYWESYSTWLSGLALFSVIYLAQADVFLVDPRIHAWSSAWLAGAAALGFLAGFWLLYDLACRTLGARDRGDLLVGIAVLSLVVIAAWISCRLFAGRAAFVLMGAMLATAMSANVFFWIIPGQRKVIAQMRAGDPVDPIHGRRAKQRSVHNTYFTLPVLVAMLSNHYGWLTQAPMSWLVLLALMLAGALIRHSFVARHKALIEGRRVPWEHAVAGTLILIVLGVTLTPARETGLAQRGPVDPLAVTRVIEQRCVVCHNAAIANKGVQLHEPGLIEQHAQAILQQAVVLRTMPLNNATGITEAERALLRRWGEQRAGGR